LLGCTTNQEEREVSSATVSNLNIEKTIKPNQGIYKLDIKFNYVINQFNEGRDIYTCSVQFITVE